MDNFKDNSELDDLLSDSFKSLHGRTLTDSFTDDVMQKVSSTAQEAPIAVSDVAGPVASRARGWILLVGLALGASVALPALMDFAAWLPQLSGLFGFLPEMGTVRGEVQQWFASSSSSLPAIRQLEPTLIATLLGAVAMCALVVFSPS